MVDNPPTPPISLSRRPKAPHPTRQILIESAQACLELHSWEHVTVEMVLERCGISRSSLYHHFKDFLDLLEQAIAEMISESTRQAIATFRSLMEDSQSADDFRQRIYALGRALQSRDRAPIRMQRLVALAATDRNDRYRLTMSREHQILNQGYQDLIEAAQAQGWIDPKADARAIALFIQAYTFGRVLDDISMDPFDEERWNALIERVFDSVLFGHLS